MPELAGTDVMSDNRASNSMQTPPIIPGISSLFGGQSGFGGMMASMASTTGRICPQSEALINRVNLTYFYFYSATRHILKANKIAKILW